MISKDKKRVTAIVSKEIKEEILKIAENKKSSESFVAAKLIQLGLEVYRKHFNKL